MKAILVLAVMIQYQVEAGQMVLVKRYTAAGCTSSQQSEEEYVEIGACVNVGSVSGPFYAGIVCNAAGHATATKYLDSSCANQDASFNADGYTGGVHNHAGACVARTSQADWETAMCVTVDTVPLTRYTDQICSTAADSASATGTGVINACEFRAGGSSKAVLLANGSAEVTTYTNTACTGTGTVAQIVDPDMCFYDGERQWWQKWNGVVNSGSSTSGSSTSGSTGTTASTSKTTLQRGFLALPLFTGVAAILF